MKTTTSNAEKATNTAAIFNSEQQAQTALDALNNDTELMQEDIKLILPHDSNFDEKLEPEDKKIAKTLVRTHAVCAVIGIIAGTIIASLLLLSGPIFLQQYTLTTYLSLSMLCAFIGVLVAGFISLRPDHDHLTNTVRTATRNGQWAIIVHTNDRQKMTKAKHLMQPFASSLSTTL
ncbi:hypothetical protein [Pseudoalteromonas mariniglutinosa]|uniref:hypothetical protein n=1 Tax=Pseudoalteromonas mariniglutinosa TaxID=206042 RepID=UPI00384BF1B0